MYLLTYLKPKALIALLILACHLPTQAQDCRLSMGWEHWQPYAYKNERDEISGLDIELVTAILDNMNCQLSLKSMPWKRLLSDTEAGKVDLVSGASYTKEREQWAYFTQPYRQETRALFVRKGSSESYAINDLNDLIKTKFKLGLTRGVYNGEAFEKMMAKPEFKKLTQVVSKESINPKKLLKGRIDGYIADAMSGSHTLRELGILDQIEIHPYTIYATDVHVLISKKSNKAERVQQFNNSLIQLQKAGTLQAIIDKYLQ
ncbi:transporter substrate-binding domain-containing protein [Dasania sp. GY-19]|uniref:Transporter substrate-binding domain-containing protein n=1 Tax=Dasania phycosphaerae TaxID=2950436 RepID=A0A9J6RIA5_9GAMM|nr:MULTISPECIES: transporter substrate-binding domain-containing protein [Dasania]MCZ0864098.1 transporter substrate-binding domain-containing protein [Dasania phycosphaerae]